ncbi:MAG: hypothetical protein QGH93_04370 [Gammaproteobacteria bacterium]|jgi:hypothetical protein|nr:hypothetical protein [Chromatiales bacterium]MDP6674070.1 hypothetical protein [Gammaproteobacteria bacterium]
MSELFAVPLLLGLVAFLIGWFVAKFSAYVGSRASGQDMPDNDHKIHALEASLRVSKKDAGEMTIRLDSSTQELQTLRASLDDLTGDDLDSESAPADQFLPDC